MQVRRLGAKVNTEDLLYHYAKDYLQQNVQTALLYENWHNMEAGLVETTSGQQSDFDARREFARLVVDEPLVYNNYGKMSAKGQILEGELNEERIEVILQREIKQ